MGLRFRRPPLTARGRARRRAIAEEVRALPARPLISVVMPTYETDPGLLAEAIESVRRQRYPNWELCIADDGSRSPEVRACARALPGRATSGSRSGCASETPASRRRPTPPWRWRGASSSPSSTTTTCCASDALLRVAQALGDDPELDVVYSDSDKLTAHGKRADPFFKPDWSPVYALGAMYVGHLLVVRRDARRARRRLRSGLRHDPGLRVHAAVFGAHRADPPHPA